MEKIIIFLAVVMLTMPGCTVTARLEHQNVRAVAEYTPREVRELTTEQEESIETKTDSSEVFFAPAVKDENGERIMSLTLDKVIVVAKSRTLAERNGQISIDFVVTLPKELLGSSRNIIVTPYLHKTDTIIALQELSIRGGLFSRVQDRNYWQFQQFVKLFHPDLPARQKAFERFVRYPYPKGVRLDSIMERKEKISYYYTQEVPTRREGKKMLITLSGKVTALDGSRYALPAQDTLEYNISSMLSFVDTTTRYITKVVEKYTVVNDKNYLSFRVNDIRIIDTLDDNREQLSRIERVMDGLMNQQEFYIDSIVLTASASPEGILSRNAGLARGRALSLRDKLAERFGPGVDTLVSVRWVAEDWDGLEMLIRESETLSDRDKILDLIRSIKHPDRREKAMREKFPKDYKFIRDSLYPLLRTVSFRYYLRRAGMVKDTIHTTEPDTMYAQGIRLLNERLYTDALRILGKYNDRNHAINLMSLGYDNHAYEILSRLPETAVINYLKAIVCSRLGKLEEGREYFIRACKLNENFEYRGRLDPEISNLLIQKK